MGAGGAASCVCDLYDDILLGSNPRTTSCALISVDELSEEIKFPEGLDPLLAMSEADESRGLPVGAKLPEDCCALMNGEERTVGVGSDGLCLTNVGAGNERGERGSRFFFSWMVITIFSRSSGVMCFSWPRLLWSEELLLRNSGRTIGEGGEACSSSNSDSFDDTLLDRAGTGMLLARGDRLYFPGCGEQQNVSRFHSLQLRFSRRLPSSMASDIFENTLCGVSKTRLQPMRRREGNRTRPHSKEVFNRAGIDGVHFIHVDFQ